MPLTKWQWSLVFVQEVPEPMVASASSKPLLKGSVMISAAPTKLPKTIDGRRPKKSEVPKGECLCDYCTAICCRYFALPIDTPEEAKDYDFIRWFLLHDRASVFVDDGVWYLLVHTNCKHLQSDFRCGIYETRPQICRDYTTDQCEYDEDTVYDMYFETAEQVAEYAEARVIAPHTENIRSPEPPLLPVLR
ncbi:MAG: YkgJ family cysteine cluster protein [Pirellulaceae bacterium]